MSTFVCSHEHINAIVAFGAMRGCQYLTWDGKVIKVHEHPGATARKLLVANTMAVNQRYDEETLCADIGYLAPRVLPTPIGVIKLCDSYNYQTSELDDYDQTAAWRIINSVIHSAIVQLPGYDEAKWSI